MFESIIGRGYGKRLNQAIAVGTVVAAVVVGDYSCQRKDREPDPSEQPSSTKPPITHQSSETEPTPEITPELIEIEALFDPIEPGQAMATTRAACPPGGTPLDPEWRVNAVSTETASFVEIESAIEYVDSRGHLAGWCGVSVGLLPEFYVDGPLQGTITAIAACSMPELIECASVIVYDPYGLDELPVTSTIPSVTA